MSKGYSSNDIAELRGVKGGNRARSTLKGVQEDQLPQPERLCSLPQSILLIHADPSML